MVQVQLLKEFTPPALFAVVGALVGVVLQYVIFPGGRRARPWVGEMFYAMLRGPIVLWCAAAGLFLANEVLTIDGRLALGVRHTLFVLLVLSVSWSIARVVGAIVAHLSRPLHGTHASATLLNNVARLAVLTVGILIILQTLGVSITPVLTALGVGGLAVGLALQDTLANFFAGIQILSSRQVRPGDYVQLATGEEGYVQDVTWRYTTIRQISNNLTVLPNSKLATTTLTNYYLPAMETALLLPVTVANDADLSRVEMVSLEVARGVVKELSAGVEGFEPYLRFIGFAKPGISFTVVIRARDIADRHLFRHELVKRLHDRYRSEQIQVL
jgi:small-conductance mechanosensitive channel